MRVAFFGAWDAGYPRNRILHDGLVGSGVMVTDVRVRERRAVFRWPALLAAWWRAPRTDAVFVPCFRHKDVPLARALAGRRPVVFDPLVSRWDTLVGDWAIHGAGSAQARWNRGLDRWSLTRADAVLCDTWAHGRLFAELGCDERRLHRVPVGAERAFFDLAPPAHDASVPVELLYVGGFLPLHGVPLLVDALARLERDATLPAWRATLVGRGIDYDAVRARAVALARVRFTGPRPYAELPATVAAAHVVLGAFGTTAKAGRVVPHKVWQGLAAGRAVVTGDGAGVREWFEDGVHALLVPRGDADALAAALARAIRDAALRARLGAAARARAAEHGTPEVLGMALRTVFEAVA